MNIAGEMSDNEFGEKLKEELDNKIKYRQSYRCGDFLDFYLMNAVILNVIFDHIRQDAENVGLSESDCLAELRRLCEPSVRHYVDCECPVCR